MSAQNAVNGFDRLAATNRVYSPSCALGSCRRTWNQSHQKKTHKTKFGERNKQWHESEIRRERKPNKERIMKRQSGKKRENVGERERKKSERVRRRKDSNRERVVGEKDKRACEIHKRGRTKQRKSGTSAQVWTVFGRSAAFDFVCSPVTSLMAWLPYSATINSPVLVSAKAEGL